MAKVKKVVKNLKKKLTKEELEELALQDQINDVVVQADAEASVNAIDTSSLPHYAEATSNDTGGVATTTSESGVIAGTGLSAGTMLAIGALAIGGIAAASGGGGGGGTPPPSDTTPPDAGTLGFTNLTDTGSDNTPDITQDNEFDLTLTGNEAGSTVAYEVSTDDGATWNTTTASQSGLTDEAYQFRAVVTDAAGNSSTTNVISVTVDNTPPIATMIVYPEVELDGMGSYDDSPQITSVGTNGEFAVTWEGHNGSNYDIFVQKFDSDGTPVGSEVQLDVMGGSDANPRITSVGTNGEFVIAWNGNIGNNYDIFVQKFDSNGIHTGSEVQLDGMGGFEDSHQITSVGTNGEFVVTWRGSNGSNSDIFVQKFDSDGIPIGSKAQLDGMGSGDGYPQITSVGTSGEFVVTWRGDDNSTFDIFVQKFDSNGTPVSSEVQLDGMGGEDSYPQITSVGTNGEFVVTWYGSNGSNYDIFVQKFDSDGTPVGSKVQLDGMGGEDSYPQITSVGTNGEFVVTWYGNNGSNYDIFVQKFDSDGTPVGSEVQLDGMGGYDSYPQITSVGTNGEFVITWNGNNGSNYDIFVQKFDSNGAVISNILAESSEVGIAYLVNDTITVNDVLDITSSTDNMWNSVDMISENTTTAMSTAGLVAGIYYLYSVDAAGNLSDPSALGYTII